MAIFSKIVIGACALASVARAAPILVTVTDVVTVTTWVTEEGTSTVWQPVTNASAVPTTTSAVVAAAVAVSSSIADVPSLSVASTTTTAALLEQAAVPSLTTTPQQLPTTVQTTTTTTTTSTTSAAAVTPQTYATSTSTSALAAATASAGSFVATSCQGSSNVCTGDITHWDGGLGACGWTVDTNTDMQIALPQALMGAQSNGNPYCGKSLTIKNPTTGSTFQATVGDKCMGCTGDSIDLTDVLFNAVTDGTGNGRVSGIEWWFN